MLFITVCFYECQCEEKSFTGLHCEIPYNENQSLSQYFGPILFTLVAGISCFVFFRGRKNLSKAESRKRNIKNKQKSHKYHVNHKNNSSQDKRKKTGAGSKGNGGTKVRRKRN